MGLFGLSPMRKPVTARFKASKEATMEPTQEGKEESSPTSPASPSYASPVKVPLPQSPAPEEAT
eukprot:4152629-Ditylum_brightwellii.AAC.1